jgi:nicotinamidase-related amidase
LDSYVYGSRQTLPDIFGDYVDVAHSAVISIDMHQGHLSESPDCPCPAPRMRDAVAGIDAFHRLARARGVPVIHVRSTLRKGGVDDLKGTPAAWRRTFALHVGPIPNSDGHAIEGSGWTEFVTEVLEEDFVVSGKKRLSAFYPTDLDHLLRSLGAKVVILNGGLTDCCVLNTAFDANNLDYRVIVARDLVRGTDAAMEEAALKMISLHLGLVMDAADIAAAWQEAL